MTQYRRLRLPGATYSFTVCLDDPASTALTDHINALRFAYAKTMAEHPATCVAMVVLPNHLHAVWTLPAGDDNFSDRWRLIKARFSHAVGLDTERGASKIAKRERGLWQRRFWEHAVRDAAELQGIVRDLRLDPVTHGLVADPQDWPYSSFVRRKDGQIAHPTRRMGDIAHPVSVPILAARGHGGIRPPDHVVQGQLG